MHFYFESLIVSGRPWFILAPASPPEKEEFGLEIWQPIQPTEVVLTVLHYFILQITKLDD